MLTAAEVGCLVFELSSYAGVLAQLLNTEEQPYGSMQGALADLSLAQPLLLGLAEAPPALRGECSPLHAVEVWELLLNVGTCLGMAGRHGDSAAMHELRRSSAQPGGPLPIELLRDVVVALPPSRPAGVPGPNFALACTNLCNALAMLAAAAAAAAVAARTRLRR